MKFAGKMCFKMVLKVTKNRSFTLSLEDTFFVKPQGGEGKCDPPRKLGLINTVKIPRRFKLDQCLANMFHLQVGKILFKSLQLVKTG